MIFQRWQIKKVNFYWLIAELDGGGRIAYGFANLNNPQFAEWGYINMAEIKRNGATMDAMWEPCTFAEAMEKIKKEEMAREGQKAPLFKPTPTCDFINSENQIIKEAS